MKEQHQCYFKRLQQVAILQVCLYLLLQLSSTAFATVFLPDSVELDQARVADGSFQRQAMDEVLFQAEPGVDYVQIDDMRFRINDLVQNDGFTGTRWTDGIVYYRFDANVDATNRQRWRNGAAQWSAVANLTFVETAVQPNYIYVQSDPGNWSYVGMIGGVQEMGIYNWTYPFIIAHEIGHALGLSHEHSRIDRDSYVAILWGNIQAGKESNFDLRSTTSYGSYDFDSVMHYSRNAFSTNYPDANTIEPKAPYGGWLDLIGQRDHLSNLDKSGMVTRYPATVPPIVSNPVPANGATVRAGSAGQVLRVTASGATSGIIHYDDDDNVDWNVAATVNGNYLEATIPYGQLTDDGTNYWYVAASNAIGTTRYPATGNLSFTVTPYVFPWVMFRAAMAGQPDPPVAPKAYWGVRSVLCCTTSGLNFSVSYGGVTKSSYVASCTSDDTWQGYATTTPGRKTFPYTLTSPTCGSMSGTVTFTLEDGKSYLIVAEWDNAVVIRVYLGATSASTPDGEQFTDMGAPVAEARILMTEDGSTEAGEFQRCLSGR